MRRRARGVENEYDGDGRIIEPSPAAAALQAVVPGDGLDPAPGGRAPAALGAARLLPAARRDPARAARAALSDLGLPVPLSVGLPPPEDRAFADVWSALGGELKPSLDVVVTAPTDTASAARPARRSSCRPDGHRWSGRVAGAGARSEAGQALTTGPPSS